MATNGRDSLRHRVKSAESTRSAFSDSHCLSDILPSVYFLKNLNGFLWDIVTTQLLSCSVQMILLHLFLYTDQKRFHIWEGNLGSQSSSVVEWLCSAVRPGFAHQHFEIRQSKAKRHIVCIVCFCDVRRLWLTVCSYSHPVSAVSSP